jgi:acetoacetyl-CoA synthetase
MTDDLIWEPSAELIDSCRLTDFLRFLKSTRGLDFSSYMAFWRWSVDELEAFWAAVFEFEGVLHDGTPIPVLASAAMPGAQWFPETRLNYAEHLLRRRRPGTPALVSVAEDGSVRETSWDELERSAGALAATLRGLGIGSGDRVVAMLPNCPEAIIGLIACASIGATWSICSPEYGLTGIVSRFEQLRPKLLIAADGYRWNDTARDRTEQVAGLIARLPTLEHLIWVADADPGAQPPGGATVTSWAQATAQLEPLTFTRVPFDHPLWVLFSSGTTGAPKGIVHGHGGIVLEHLRSAAQQFDLRPGDVSLVVATTSWMVWNTHVSGLLSGCTLVLLDGNPTATLDRIWRVIAQLRVTSVSLGAGYILASMKGGLQPADSLDFSALRMISATGSPLPANAYRWVADRIGKHVWQACASGGTDVCSAFVAGNPISPVRAGRMQGPCGGVAAAAWDEHGRPVTGSLGELVITKPMPSMPVFLWDDSGGERIRETYFSTFPGVWRQGDFIEFDEDGTCVIPGRSDSTLNRRGIRIGPAELYTVVEQFPDVNEALVVGAELGDEYYMPLFVDAGDDVDENELRGRIIAAIRDVLSPRHVPDEILFVPGIPHTRTGKKLEVPVKRIVQGASVADAVDPGSVDHPELLDTFAELVSAHRAG